MGFDWRFGVGIVSRFHAAAALMANVEDAGGGLSYPWSVPIVNGGAELGGNPLTGWTVILGSLLATTGPAGDGTLPHSGSQLMYGGSASYSAGTQDVTIDAALLTDVDAGLLTVDWSYYLCCTGTDSARVGIYFLDAVSAVIGSSFPALSSPGGANVWVLMSFSAVIPVDTRFLRFQVEMDRNAGTSNDGYIDDLIASVRLT